MAQRQIPGGAFLNETTTGQYQIPGGGYANAVVSGDTTIELTAASFAFTPRDLTLTAPGVSGSVRRFGAPTQLLGPYGTGVFGQGVAADATRRWLSESGTLHRLNTSWVTQTSRNVVADDPASKSQVNGLAYCVGNGRLYAGANNYPTATPKAGWVVEYNATDLTWIATHDVGAHWCEGCAIDDNGDIWAFYHDYPYVSRYDSAWNFIADYALPGDVSDDTDNLFQGGYWIDNDLYLIKHNVNPLNAYYIFRWDGVSQFALIEQAPPPKYNGFYAGQGIAFDVANNLAWWVKRESAPTLYLLETSILEPNTPSSGWAPTPLCSTMTGQFAGGIQCTLDTTGADLLVCSINAATSPGTPTIADSLGNTWNLIRAVTTTANRKLFVYYCKPSAVGAGHNITETGASAASMYFGAFSGSATLPLDQDNGADATTQAGSITPTEDDELILAFLNSRVDADYTIDSGFTVDRKEPYEAGFYDGLGVAYLVQGAAAAVNPAWSQTGTAIIVSFKAAPGDVTGGGSPLVSARRRKRR